MSTKPFSKSFLGLFNKRKIERTFPITTGPAQGSQPAQGRFRLYPKGTETGDTARLGLPAQGHGGAARRWRPSQATVKHEGV
jgi:hypothetical protein